MRLKNILSLILIITAFLFCAQSFADIQIKNTTTGSAIYYDYMQASGSWSRPLIKVAKGSSSSWDSSVAEIMPDGNYLVNIYYYKNGVAVSTTLSNVSGKCNIVNGSLSVNPRAQEITIYEVTLINNAYYVKITCQ